MDASLYRVSECHWRTILVSLLLNLWKTVSPQIVDEKRTRIELQGKDNPWPEPTTSSPAKTSKHMDYRSTIGGFMASSVAVIALERQKKRGAECKAHLDVNMCMLIQWYLECSLMVLDIFRKYTSLLKFNIASATGDSKMNWHWANRRRAISGMSFLFVATDDADSGPSLPLPMKFVVGGCCRHGGTPRGHDFNIFQQWILDGQLTNCQRPTVDEATSKFLPRPWFWSWRYFQLCRSVGFQLFRCRISTWSARSGLKNLRSLWEPRPQIGLNMLWSILMASWVMLKVGRWGWMELMPSIHRTTLSEWN